MTTRVNTPRLMQNEQSGLRLNGAWLRLGRLHRAQRGNVAILFLFFGLVFYCLIAMVWNTGVITSAKIETQTAADAAAYSSTVWTSRTLNLTTGTNMLIMRNASAHVAGAAAALTQVGMVASFAIYPIFRGFQCGTPVDPVTAAAYWTCFSTALAYVVGVALPAWITFTIEAWDGIEAYWRGDFLRRIRELHQLQTEWIMATDVAIEEQRVEMEAYYGCDIHLVRPGLPGAITPPLKRGNLLSFGIPFGARVAREVYFNPDRWQQSTEFRLMRLPGWIPLLQPTPIWYGAALVETIRPLLIGGANHYVLTTQWGPLEFGPVTPQEWRDFTIVATARKRADNSASGQPPRAPLALLAPGIFDETVVPMAYAQAETFNGIDGHLTNAAGAFAPLRLLSTYPFRVWTPWGWQWQPRLTRGDLLPDAIRSDATLQQWYDAVGVEDPEDVRDLTLH